jgi:hypothetical protein
MDSEAIKVLLQQGVPTLLVVGTALFLTLRVWPWWTREYLPSRDKIAQDMAKMQMARDERRETAMDGLRDAIVQLGSTMLALQEMIRLLPEVTSTATGLAIREQTGRTVAEAQIPILDRLNQHDNSVTASTQTIIAELQRGFNALQIDIQRVVNVEQRLASKEAVQRILDEKFSMLRADLLTVIASLLRPTVGVQPVQIGATSAIGTQTQTTEAPTFTVPEGGL